MMNEKEFVAVKTVQFMLPYMDWFPVYKQSDRYGYIKGFNYHQKDVDKNLNTDKDESLHHLISELMLILDLIETLVGSVELTINQKIALLSYVYSSDKETIADGKVFLWLLLCEHDIVSEVIRKCIYINGRTSEQLLNRRLNESKLYLGTKEKEDFCDVQYV